MIQSQNNFIQSKNEYLQSIDRLEVKMSHLIKIINDRDEKTLPNILLTIPDSHNHIDWNQGHGVLEILTKIQFHHNILNLINTNPLTNWQVFHSMKLNLIMNVTMIPDFVIQFQFLNLC